MSKWRIPKAKPAASCSDQKAYQAEYYRLRKKDPEFILYRASLRAKRKSRSKSA